MDEGSSELRWHELPASSCKRDFGDGTATKVAGMPPRSHQEVVVGSAKKAGGSLAALCALALLFFVLLTWWQELRSEAEASLRDYAASAMRRHDSSGGK